MEINCDLGENLAFLENGTDKAFMTYVNAINIACTFHAGSTYIIEKTIENALEKGIHIGFHPSFNDVPNFGRMEIALKFDEIKSLIHEQYDIIYAIANRLGATIRHIKPHGALYNMSAKNNLYAQAIAEATLEIDSNLILVGLSQSFSIVEAQKLGLNVQNEVFADRAYDSNGALVNRNIAGAVFSDLKQIEIQASAFLKGNKIKTIDNEHIRMIADTICVHSDTPNGLKIAELLRNLHNEKI